MLTPSRMGRTEAIITTRTGLPVHPLGAGHYRLGAQLRDDRGEVLEVINLEVDRQVREVWRFSLHADVIDVAVVLGDDLGDLRQRAWLVDRLHGDARRKAARVVVHVPAHVEPAPRRV